MDNRSSMRRVLHSKIDRRVMLQAMAGATALSAGVQLTGAARSGAAGATPERARGSLSLAHRIPEEHWRADQRFALLLRVLNTYRSAVDEAVLDEGSSFWSSLAQIERSNEILKRRIAQLKEAGWPTGINFGLTMGHGDSDAASLPPLPFQPTVGHDGTVFEQLPLPQQPGVPRLYQQKI